MAYLQVNFFSEALDRKTTFHALIPIDHWKGRDVGRNERPAPLKSLYLLCGYSGDEMDWIHYSTVRSLSEQYNVAVFMPEGGNFFIWTMWRKESVSERSSARNWSNIQESFFH